MIFVVITYGITISLAVAIYQNGGLYGGHPYQITSFAGSLLTATMFAPAAANIMTRLLTRERWSNTFLRPNLRRGWRFYLAAWLLPVVATLVGGAIYYALYPAKLDLSMQGAREAGLVAASSPWTLVMGQTVLAVLLTAPTKIFRRTFGEEFGWQAYLLPKLMPLGPRTAVLLTGVIWAAFHWPAILMGYEYGLGYWGAPVVGLLLFALATMMQCVFHAWLTMRTRSVWPAAIAHSVTNNVAGVMLPLLSGEVNPLIGPMAVGIVGMLGYAILALIILVRPRALSQPASAPVGTAVPEGAAALGKAAV